MNQHDIPLSNNTQRFRKLTLLSYVGLLLWLPLWLFVFSHHNLLSAGFVVLIYILPLLLPIRGLFAGKPYTHAWTNFIVMWYLMHALTSLYAVPQEWPYALIELLLVAGLFVGCIGYARLRGRELGLGLPKLKQEMADEKAYFERKIE